MDRRAVENRLTKRIRIWGIVQGVGFRPFVAKLADAMDIKGEVRNLGGLVDIVVTDQEERIAQFIEEIRTKKPLPAEIVHIKIEDLPLRLFDSFVILDSLEVKADSEEAAMISADLAICKDCLREMADIDDPRYAHPYISCMACGPRYTIIDRIPYDRENTTMVDFEMCSFCQGEYEDRQSRRYHAQTISCLSCGPYNKLVLDVENTSFLRSENSKALEQAIEALRGGGILAVKGIGGYNFICSPFDGAAVKTLRQIKLREEKPFAIMFNDIAQIKEYCHVDKVEEELLESSARPILLLRRSAKDYSNERLEVSPLVTNASRFIGAFLPSTGLHYQLTASCGPLIATSANISEMPMIKDDQEMMRELSRLKTEMPSLPQMGQLYNDRDIRVRLDDSVVRVIDQQPQMIRRAKGYAPVPLLIANEGLSKSDMILATGGQLKSAFCLTKGNYAYVSQYLGDLDQQQSCMLYDESIHRLKVLFNIKPELVVCDLHPLYYTTKFAQRYIDKFSEQVPHEILKVQHHHAHVASVMAENDLLGKILGVSFDGTGYGTDGAIWGGEFLICEGSGFQRAAHLDYIKMLGGDSSMKEGWKSAMCYSHAYALDLPANDERYDLIKAGIDHQINTINSSSMGRLFDAVASYLDIHHVNRYEGECAIMLENYAADALDCEIEPYPMSFGIRERQSTDGYSVLKEQFEMNSRFDEHDPIAISAQPIFMAIKAGIRAGSSREAMALGFHYAVSDLILDVSKKIRIKEGINKVALTGGVFQNKIVMERTLKLLRQEGFDVYYNISVGPNDGGICLGQAYIGMQHLSHKNHKTSI